jgi:hypothetical protein
MLCTNTSSGNTYGDGIMLNIDESRQYCVKLRCSDQYLNGQFPQSLAYLVYQGLGHSFYVKLNIYWTDYVESAAPCSAATAEDGAEVALNVFVGGDQYCVEEYSLG